MNPYTIPRTCEELETLIEREGRGMALAIIGTLYLSQSFPRDQLRTTITQPGRYSDRQERRVRKWFDEIASEATCAQ
jgi:hypothetical protein